jgi:hypothetical protein
VALRRLSTSSIQTNGKSSKLWDQTTFQSGMFALATINLASSASSVVFSDIPQNYTHLQIRATLKSNRATFGNDGLYLRVNGASSNYGFHYLLGDGAASSASGGGSQTQILLGWCGTNVSSAYGANVIDILDYSNTTKYKTIRNLAGVDVNGTIAGFGGVVGIHSGAHYANTNAITSITFTTSNAADFQQYSQFALYGIKAG